MTTEVKTVQNFYHFVLIFRVFIGQIFEYFDLDMRVIDIKRLILT